MQIVLTATRHDVAMISEGRFTQPPDYVVVARIVMTTKGALELAEAIKSTVAKHQAMTGRLHSRVFYDFPAERWKHLRTTNVVESSFATVRHRTVRSKGCLSNKTALAMIFKLAEAAERSWRRLDGHNQLPKVILGVKFTDGIEVVRSQAQTAAA